jgi:hypothetical protein
MHSIITEMKTASSWLMMVAFRACRLAVRESGVVLFDEGLVV